MHFCYILYSPNLDSYYVGETQDYKVRLMQHNNGFFELSYTKRSNDWGIWTIIECIDIVQARKIESHIKKMKSRIYIENLKEYPEIIEKLLNQYS